MSEKRRKLSAILFADIVKFSDLMVADESECIRIRDAIAALAYQSAEAHNGTVGNEAGDGFMLIFDSAVEAIEAAIDLQRSVSEAALRRPDGTLAQVRIGIHSGDIIKEGDSFIGDAINVASRVETVALPGGICVTADIEAQVRPILRLSFIPVKRKPAKALPRPVAIFDVGSELKPGARQSPAASGKRRIFCWLAAFVAVATVVGILANIKGGATTPTPFPAKLYIPDDERIVLYSDPDVSSEVVGAIKRGAEVVVEEKRGPAGGQTWLRVTLNPGWMAAQDLRQEEGTMISISEDGASGKVIYTGADGLNLRTSPDYASKVYAKILEGTLLAVAGEELKTATHVWRQVEVGSAWVNSTPGADDTITVVPMNQ